MINSFVILKQTLRFYLQQQDNLAIASCADVNFRKVEIGEIVAPDAVLTIGCIAVSG